MNYQVASTSKSKTIALSSTSNTSQVNTSVLSNSSNGVVARMESDVVTRERVKKEIDDFRRLGIIKGANAQMDIAEANIAEKGKLGRAVEVMAIGLKRYQGKVEEKDQQILKQKLELEAYEKSLGRKLSEKEINEYLDTHKPPSTIIDSDKAIMDELDDILNQSRQITKS
jgi:hypothetical protein